jgi:hypothetical protein
MIATASVGGFEIADALEPPPPREAQVAEVVEVAAFLGPASASPGEAARCAAEVSEAAQRDQGLLQEAQREAQHRLAQGRCTKRAVALLSAARGQGDDVRSQQIRISYEQDQLVLKVSGPLTGELGNHLAEVVGAAVEVMPAVALDLRDVREWTSEGLESLERCANRGAELDGSPGHRG